MPVAEEQRALAKKPELFPERKWEEPVGVFAVSLQQAESELEELEHRRGCRGSQDQHFRLLS